MPDLQPQWGGLRKPAKRKCAAPESALRVPSSITLTRRGGCVLRGHPADETAMSTDADRVRGLKNNTNGPKLF